MLSILRRNAGSWAIKIILSFIALTFIWWGVGTYSEQDRNVAATVGGETITLNELSEAVAGLEKTYREVYGPAFTPEMAKALDLKKQAMDSCSSGSSCSGGRDDGAVGHGRRVAAGDRRHPRVPAERTVPGRPVPLGPVL